MFLNLLQKITRNKKAPDWQFLKNSRESLCTTAAAKAATAAATAETARRGTRLFFLCQRPSSLHCFAPLLLAPLCAIKADLLHWQLQQRLKQHVTKAPHSS